MKKLLSIMLSSVLLLGLAAGCGGNNAPSEEPAGSQAAAQGGEGATGNNMHLDKLSEDPMAAIPQAEILARAPKTEPKGTLTVGDITEPDANIMAGWTNPSSNQNARYMLSGYAMVVSDRDGVFVRNNVVVKDLKRTENADKSVTYEVEIYDNLKFSDGSKIDAKHFVAGYLIGSTKAMEEIEGSATDGESLLGYKEFYEGDGSATPFTGVRLLGDYKLSVTLNPEELPNYFEVPMALNMGPTPYKQMLGEDMDVKDDGKGAAMTKPMTKELFEEKINNSQTGFRYTYAVSSGPYKFVQYDKNNKALILEANPEFLGTFDGQKPQIQKVIIKYVQSKTMMDQLANGQVDLLSSTGGATSIESGKAKMNESNGRIGVKTFDRNGYGKIEFACDVGATQFPEVRQAIAYAIDRQAFLKSYTGGYGSLVYSQYGLAQSEYKANKKKLDSELNQYTYDLNKAKEVLVAGGWTLDANGNEYQSGTRYKKLEDGTLMPLEVRWAQTDSPVVELLLSTLPTNLAGLGFDLKTQPTDFPVMLEAMSAAPGTEKRNQFNMYVLATGFAKIMPHWYYVSQDPKYLQYNQSQIKDDKLVEIGKKLQNTKPGDVKSWNAEWFELQKRYNELCTEIPLYSDLYHQFYDQKKLKNFEPSALVSYGDLMVYSSVAE